MTIEIESLSIEAIIGILDFERVTPQRVSIDISASYEYRDEKFINYADIISLVEGEVISQKFELLEEALLALKRLIISSYPNIDRLYIKISKPDIIENATVSLSDLWTR
ncbi:Dihydroneopterin aldolase [hydrothermal vent metagenome]|uniref:Dihydroneopterin aldolase n=1 Tax=hydrothermal vent metagenome TaxID=652676 RepID=A0A1W1BCW8_9ZZZZ